MLSQLQMLPSIEWDGWTCSMISKEWKGELYLISGTHKDSTRESSWNIVGASADIRTWYVPNTSEARHIN